MATTILGKVACTPKGAWSSGASYEVLDIVSNAGSSYIAKQSVPAGTALSDTDYWLKIASKGDTGQDGQDGTDGADGFSPVVTVTAITGGHQVDITDALGTQSFNVMDGEDGDVQSDGVYPQLTAGNAQELDSDLYTTDSVPYLLRQSGGGKSIGTRERDTIVGGSIVANQLVGSSATSVTVPNSHKYASTINGTWAVGSSSGSAISVTGGTDMVIDLTQMFGNTVADYLYNLGSDNAITLLRKLGYIDDTYKAYNAGTLAHVSGLTNHVTLSKNLCPNPTATTTSGGALNTSTGRFGKVIKGWTYTISVTNRTASTAYTAIRVTGSGGVNEVANNLVANGRKSFTFTASVTGEVYFSNSMGSSYASMVVLEDIQLELGSSATDYEPYKAQSYPLDSSLTLRGIPKVVDNEIVYDGDTYEADGTVTRKYGIVDLGTLNWVRQEAEHFMYSTGISSLVKVPASNNTIANILCETMVATSSNGVDVTSGNLIGIVSNGNIRARFDGFPTTSADFKTAVSGVYLVYELATPTTEQATGFTNPQVVDAYGTEAYEGTPIPCGHLTEYPVSQKNKLDKMPSEMFYTEQAFKATRAYTANQLIVINGQLYKVATSIASGATLTVGTNIISTTLGDIITALLNA